VGERLLAKIGANRAPDPLKAARAVSWEKIIEAGRAVNEDLNMPMGPWDSVVDGWFLADSPASIFKAGKQNVVPFIMGANLGELTGPGNIYMPQVIQKYTNLFSGANLVGSKAYGYIFDQVPSKWKQEGCVCTHAMELCYVFGDWDNSSGFWTNLYRMAASSGAKQPDPGLTEIDKKVSEALMTIWAQFARTGDPNVTGLIHWPPWEPATDRYLLITEPLQVKSGYSQVAQKQNKSATK
jgi:para-nitrobenzyl esterase